MLDLGRRIMHRIKYMSSNHGKNYKNGSHLIDVFTGGIFWDYLAVEHIHSCSYLCNVCSSCLSALFLRLRMYFHHLCVTNSSNFLQYNTSDRFILFCFSIIYAFII